MKLETSPLPYVILGVSILLGCWLLGHNYYSARHDLRYVSVKGIAEKQVEADFAVWPIRITAAHNNLTDAQNKISKDTKLIAEFLGKYGVPEAAISTQSPEVTDAQAQVYREGASTNRFIIAQTILVRTDQVAAVAEAASQVGALISAGVVLSGNYGQSGPYYKFTKLNDIKPAMIAEATKNAKDAAEQFARDSGARVGGIRTANQGLFQILAFGEAPGIMEENNRQKIVRVVTTVDYELR